MGISASSGPGYARGSFPGWGDATGASGGSGAGGALGWLSSALDPNLIREAMLQGLQQREEGFSQWQQNQQLQRQIAQANEQRTAVSAKDDLKRKKRADSTAATERSAAAPTARKARENALERDTAATQAETGRVPTRMSTVGTQTFATPDPLKMSGAQRARFLPNQASMIGGLSRMDLSGIRSDAAWDKMISDDRERAREGR